MDRLIVNVIFFIYGSLLSWALFYKWGSFSGVVAVDYSGWLQFFSSLLAVGAAIYVPTKIHALRVAREEEQRAYEASVFAYKVKPLILKFRSAVLNSRSRFMSGDPCSEIDWMVEPIQGVSREGLDIDGMHVLGGVFFKITIFVDSIPEIESALSDLDFYLRYSGVYVDHESGEQFDLDEPADPVVFYERSLAFADEAICGLDAVMEKGRGFL